MVEVREWRKEFAIEEWKDLRQQVNILLSAIWKLEMSTIGGLAIYYAWYFTYESSLKSGDLTVVHVASLVAPVIFLPLIIIRLKIEYAILMRLGQYCERSENFFNDRTYVAQSPTDDGSPMGWQRFLGLYSPDVIPYSEVKNRYRHTFRFFTAVALMSAVFAFYRLGLWDWFKVVVCGG